jgi:hypothetical protein
MQRIGSVLAALMVFISVAFASGGGGHSGISIGPGVAPAPAVNPGSSQSASHREAWNCPNPAERRRDGVG